MGIRKIKKIIKELIKLIISILALTAFILAVFYWIAVIINFFVPMP